MPTSANSPTAGETRDTAAGVPGSETAPPTNDPPAEGSSDTNTGQSGGKFIQFKGADFIIRRLEKADYDRAGVAAPKTPVEWSAQAGGNDHKVDVSDWSQDQIDATLKMDDRFKVVD